MLDSASRLSKIIELVDLPIGAFEINLQSHKVVIVGQLYEILGIQKDNRTIIESTENFNALLNEILSYPEQGKEDIYKLSNQKERWVRIKINTSQSHIYGVVEDVSEEVLHLKRIKRDRDLDPLTKLLNHASFQMKFKQWTKEVDIGFAALIMFDLDHLKQINDTYGHKWGDYYIIEAARQLKEMANENHIIIARRSGDEFVVLLHGYQTKQELKQVLLKFYDQLSINVLEFPNGDMKIIKISAGFILLESPKTKMDYDFLLHCADEALYYSKYHNKGSFTEYDTSLIVFDE